MSVKRDIKVLLAANDVSITFVAQELSRITGKNYSRSNLSQKLMRGTLRYEEAQMIGEILGYKLKFIRSSPITA